MEKRKGQKFSIFGGIMIAVGLVFGIANARTAIPTSTFQLMMTVAIVGAILCVVGTLMDIYAMLEGRTETPQNAPSEPESEKDE